MREKKGILSNIDGLTMLLYLALVVMGWFNIFSAVYDPQLGGSVLDFGLKSTKQLIWIGCALFLIIVIMTLNYRFYELYAYLIYAVVLVLLLAVLIFGTKINGARSWFTFAGFSLQPSEFAKFATALALGKFVVQPTTQLNKFQDILVAGALAFSPMLLILAQNDTGSVLIFLAFLLPLYREGLPSWIPLSGLSAVVLFVLTLVIDNKMFIVIPILIITLSSIIFLERTSKNIQIILVLTLLALGYLFSVDYVFQNVLKGYQQERIKVLIDEDIDEQGRGISYNLRQSKIAYASGGVWGKGFLKGTQTKGGYVPEQSTDFIFCTVGEEHGWLGSLLVILVFMLLLWRLVILAERQKDAFVRSYGYSVAGILFFHFAINIAMTLGLFPVVGIPLPFFSYGGSSLWGFTILLFIFIKLDAHRDEFATRG